MFVEEISGSMQLAMLAFAIIGVIVVIFKFSLCSSGRKKHRFLIMNIPAGTSFEVLETHLNNALSTSIRDHESGNWDENLKLIFYGKSKASFTFTSQQPLDNSKWSTCEKFGQNRLKILYQREKELVCSGDFSPIFREHRVDLNLWEGKTVLKGDPVDLQVSLELLEDPKLDGQTPVNVNNEQIQRISTNEATPLFSIENELNNHDHPVNRRNGGQQNRQDVMKAVHLDLARNMYLYVSEFYEADVKKICSQRHVMYSYDYTGEKLKLEGQERQVSACAKEIAELFQKRTSDLEEATYTLPADVDLGRFQQKLARSLVARQTNTLIVPEGGGNFKLYGPKATLGQVRNELKKLAQEDKPPPPPVLPVISPPMRPSDSGKDIITSSGIRVSIFKGDLTKQTADAIVCPSNPTLQHGGGAAKFIAQAAGSQLTAECNQYLSNYGPLNITGVMHTDGYKLNPQIRYVIHTAGPTGGDNEDPVKQQKLLETTFFNCLSYANNQLRATSIAIPAIGSGVFGIPKDLVARAAFSAVTQFDRQVASAGVRNLKSINFVNIDDEATDAFGVVFKRWRRQSFHGSSENIPGFAASASGVTVDQPRRRSRSEDDAKRKRQLKQASPTSDDNKIFNGVADGSRSSGMTNGAGIKFQRVESGGDVIGQGFVAAAPVGRSPLSPVNGYDAGRAGADDRRYRSSSSTRKSEADAGGKAEDCVICMDAMVKPKELPCGHKFCEDCIAQSFDKCQPKCPSCGKLFGAMKGNQPPGTMNVTTDVTPLPGFDRYQTLVIDYSIPSGTQTELHPNPGQTYHGTHRRAYLPDNPDGREVCDLLHRAFNAGLIFTVGQSTTNGLDNQVIWNDIHHKTSNHKGPYGYPDPAYLSRVKEELKAKGIISSSSPSPVSNAKQTSI